MKFYKTIISIIYTKEILAYIAVGLLGVVVDFSVFYLAIYIKMPLLIAQWSGALLGFTHNHIWQHYRVFKHNQSFEKTYTISIIVSVISIVLSGPILLFLDSVIPLIWLNKIIILGLTFIALYFFKKRFVFITIK